MLERCERGKLLFHRYFSFRFEELLIATELLLGIFNQLKIKEALLNSKGVFS